MKINFSIQSVRILLFLTSIFAAHNFYGCSDSITNSNTTAADKYKARSENEFNTSAGVKAIPGAVIYDDLEHLNTPADSVNGDTGNIGEDVIPYSYPDSAVHRIKLSADAGFKARLVSDAGAVIWQLNNPGDTARVLIPSGNYKLYLTSLRTFGLAAGISQPVFIQPDLDAIASGGVLPQAGYDKKDLNTLLTTNKCINCNLKELQLQDKNLSGADISGATLYGAFLQNVNLSNAVLVNTELSRGGGRDINFTGATFTSTFMYYTGYERADFTGAKFQHLLWDHTALSGCNLKNVTIDSGAAYNASLDGADMSYSTIKNASWRNVSADGTKFIKSVFNNIYCYEGFFANSVIDSSMFINGCNFTETVFRDGKARYTSFTDFRGDATIWDNNDMSWSKVSNGFFAGGSLRASILRNVNFNNVNVMAVNMCHQDRTGGVFTNIQYNSDTDCWP
jgi:uncharacterized protein YjbI with pentapeptide repeats